jgi:hypothetical protein
LRLVLSAAAPKERLIAWGIALGFVSTGLLLAWTGEALVDVNRSQTAIDAQVVLPGIRPAKSSCGSAVAQGCLCPRHFIADTWTLQESSCRAGLASHPVV